MTREAAMNIHETFAARVNAYLNDRWRAGFALSIEGRKLEQFESFADHLGHQGPLTVKPSVSKRPGALTAARRIEVVHPFAGYCHQFDTAPRFCREDCLGRLIAA